MAGLEGEISITSHFVGFRVSPLFAAKVRTVLICSCRVARELLIVRMSSAWMKPPAYMSPTDRPRPLFCKDFKRGVHYQQEEDWGKDGSLENSALQSER